MSDYIFTGVTSPLAFDCISKAEESSKQQLSLAQEAFKKCFKDKWTNIEFKGYDATVDENGKKKIHFQHQKKGDKNNQYRFSNLKDSNGKIKYDYLVVLRTNDNDEKVEGKVLTLNNKNVDKFNGNTRNFDDFNNEV